MTRRAVVIGPSTYAANSGLVNTPWTAVSARMYQEVLENDGTWDECRLVREDELATPDGVMRVVQEVAEAAVHGDALMVVYIGHGYCWSDLPGGEQVYFSVESSYEDRPWTWLSSWYIYHVMRKSRASLKALIADCCYSNLLPKLGAHSPAWDPPDKGSCVFAATHRDPYENPIYTVGAEGCSALPEELRNCTPFSGHLLRVLKQGTSHYGEELTLGMVRDAVVKSMDDCPTNHETPNMIFSGVRERAPLFVNRMDVARRSAPPSPPVKSEQWVASLMSHQEYDVLPLLRDPRQTGEVVARLIGEKSSRGKVVASDIARQAQDTFKQPADFARYWSQVERALRR